MRKFSKLVTILTSIALIIVVSKLLSVSDLAEAVKKTGQQWHDTPTYSEPVGGNHSYNWAGYTATGGTFTEVHGSWTVPEIDQTTNMTADAEWIGIGGVSGDDLIQVGTQAITSKNGPVNYQAWYELLPAVSQPVALEIKPGDLISASIVKQGDENKWKISLRNNHTGKEYENVVEYTSSHSSAEWIAEMPMLGKKFIPLDDFGTIAFTDASAVSNGKVLSIHEANSKAMTMVNSSEERIAIPSILGHEGDSFTITRTNAPVIADEKTITASGGPGAGAKMKDFGELFRTFMSPFGAFTIYFVR